MQKILGKIYAYARLANARKIAESDAIRKILKCFEGTIWKGKESSRSRLLTSWIFRACKGQKYRKKETCP